MAAYIESQTGAPVDIESGDRGEFTVFADSVPVISKDYDLFSDNDGFPSEEQCLDAINKSGI